MLGFLFCFFFVLRITAGRPSEVGVKRLEATEAILPADVVSNTGAPISLSLIIAFLLIVVIEVVHVEPLLRSHLDKLI